MTTLHDLYRETRQSPWIDDLKRSYVDQGGLAALIAQGIRGVTSNPTIMAKAIASTNDYDREFSELIRSGCSVEEAYWELVMYDILGALRSMRSVYDESDGIDGYVSLEVAPDLAHDVSGTITSARSLHERINQPNLMVKIPATEEGVIAVEQMISEGRSINVTLIFSLERYAKVIEAYIRGIERLVDRGGDPKRVASVASFFVSRVDTEVDRRLGADSPAAGRTALAQARLAYRQFLDAFNSPRFKALAAIGARAQRPLWASTSTKNPAYPDLLYVEGLVAKDTVNTLPVATMSAFLEHGRAIEAIGSDFSGDEKIIADLGAVGIDLKEVTDLLEVQGLASFAASFNDLLTALTLKSESLRPTP